jgi:membrane protein HdeD
MSSAPTAPDAEARQPVLTVRRTGWDVLLGLLLIAVGVVILGDVVIASVLSVLFVGWTMLIGGAAIVIGSLFRIGEDGLWLGLFGGALTLVTGLVFVRYPGATLLTLMLVTGALLILGGLVRIVTAFSEPGQRLVLLISGALSVILGVLLLDQWPKSALWLLGTLLGIQLVVDGLLLIVLGRLRPAR